MRGVPNCQYVITNCLPIGYLWKKNSWDGFCYKNFIFNENREGSLVGEFFFKKMDQCQPLFHLFLSFQTNIPICEKCPSRIRCWDLNPWPSVHESPPIATSVLTRTLFVGNWHHNPLWKFDTLQRQKTNVLFLIGNGIEQIISSKLTKNKRRRIKSNPPKKGWTDLYRVINQC